MPYMVVVSLETVFAFLFSISVIFPVGFFHFYAKHVSHQFYATSIRRASPFPKAGFQKANLAFWSIEDPFETVRR